MEEIDLSCDTEQPTEPIRGEFDVDEIPELNDEE